LYYSEGESLKDVPDFCPVLRWRRIYVQIRNLSDENISQSLKSTELAHLPAFSIKRADVYYEKEYAYPPKGVGSKLRVGVGG
jgi:hypothetical protein